MITYEGINNLINFFFTRRFFAIIYNFSLCVIFFFLRFLLVPDAGDTSVAVTGGGVLEGVERRVIPLTFLEGMIRRGSPVEYRLSPRKRAAI